MSIDQAHFGCPWHLREPASEGDHETLCECCIECARGCYAKAYPAN